MSPLQPLVPLPDSSPPSSLSGSTRVLYGEWLCARHTVAYDKLPDWFVAFDIFDVPAGRFLSRRVLLAGDWDGPWLLARLVRLFLGPLPELASWLGQISVGSCAL